MLFDEEHKVVVSTLTREEAPQFIYFLQDEVKRHKKAKEEADFMWCMRPIISKIYESAAIRHKEDIEAIDLEIKKVKEMFGL